MALALFACAALGSCRIARSNDWNLKELHDDESRHRYSAALEGDFEYFLRHDLTSMLSATGARLAEKSPSPVDDPGSECLDNLLDLAQFDGSDARTSALQVEWFARLAVEDPWKLSRERATYGLGKAGKRLAAGLPVKLPDDPPAAGAPEVSAALSALGEAAKALYSDSSSARSTARLDLEAACELVRGLTLDVAGARRALRVTSELAGARGLRSDDAKALLDLSLDLQQRCVRQALAAALIDREPWVRAAAVQASVDCAGLGALDPMLSQLRREPAPEVVIRVMHIVRDRGLPDVPAELGPEAAARIRNAWLGSIYSLLLERPEGPVRVAAMQALSKVSGAGITSLREEDWQSWWLARAESPVSAEPAASGGPAP